MRPTPTERLYYLKAFLRHTTSIPLSGIRRRTGKIFGGNCFNLHRHVAVASYIVHRPHGVRVVQCYSTLARRTSLMTQFQRVKEQYPNHLLLFQVGDFYELYGDDASEYPSHTHLSLTHSHAHTHTHTHSISHSLSLSLLGEASSKTSLRLTRKAGILMAGFPVRSLDEWQRILIEAGLQLAICNQQPSKK